jgi:hypothetical protein
VELGTPGQCSKSQGRGAFVPRESPRAGSRACLPVRSDRGLCLHHRPATAARRCGAAAVQGRAWRLRAAGRQRPLPLSEVEVVGCKAAFSKLITWVPRRGAAYLLQRTCIQALAEASLVSALPRIAYASYPVADSYAGQAPPPSL